MGFTVLTIVVLAGGLGISIYTYAVLNAMLYKDLPLPGSASIVRVAGEKDGRIGAVGAYEMSEMRAAGIRRLEEIGVYETTSAVLSSIDGRTRALAAVRAEWNVFEFSRVRPQLGRGFIRNDAIEGAEPVVVLGHGVWQSVFAGDPDILDRVVRINGRLTRVVGVMPEGYAFPGAATAWLPMSNREVSPFARSDASVDVYARLAPGASPRSAGMELDSLLERVHAQTPGINAEETRLDGMTVLTFQEFQTYPDGPFVFGILNVVSLFILLLACVNIGNMLLARTNERLKEIAVRVALGAPRLRLVFQMMLESVIICVAGGILAIFLAGWGLHATNGFMNSTLEGHLPYWWQWGIDLPTVVAGLAFVLLAIALVSALPTYSATRVNSNTLLRDGTRGARGRASGRISRALVTLQIVLISVIMVVGSAMALIAYRAAHIDFGIDTERLLTTTVSLPVDAYPEDEQRTLFYDRLLQELRGNREVEAAMVSSNLGETRFALDGVEYNVLDDYPLATAIVGSQAPEPVGTRLLEGRYFDSRDVAGGLATVIVSEALAQAYWPGESALGRRVRLVDEAGKVLEQRTIVGVMSNVRRGENLLVTDSQTYAALYVPLAQSPVDSAGVLVKYRGSESDARSAIYQAISRVDAYVVPGPISSYSEVLQKLTVMATTMTDIFVKCGIFALLLAMTGIYGLSSNAVVQRTHEIGLRRAIGATDAHIIRLFMATGMRQLAVGLVVSALICVAIMFLVSRFAGVGAGTLTVIGVLVVALVSALVLAAIYISTSRAVRHEPSVALRYE
nr:ABC transporter permease [Lysobacter spongiae]